MKDNELMWRVRGMLANHVMGELLDDTRGLVDKYGYDGAEDYFNWRLKILRDMRENEETFGGADDEL